MARQIENGHVTLQVNATVAVTRFALVKLTSGLIVLNTVTETDVPVGVVQNAGAVNTRQDVRLLSDPGTFKMVASGVIALGADVYAAAIGKISALPVGAGDYRRVGQALEAAAADEDIIEVLPSHDHHIETVT